VAADASPSMLAYSRERLARAGIPPERVRFLRCDAGSLPFAAASFDLYASSFLFDLLPEPELWRAIEEMERVLAPGGTAVLATMTTDLSGLPLFSRVVSRWLVRAYANPVWRALFSGYAPHCRPIDLSRRLRGRPALDLEATSTSRVAGFPVRIHRVRRRHG
jgi:ubiquinone/menaquinone biosynthesis C-methylase UbiE